MKLHKISDSVTDINKDPAPSKRTAAGMTMSRRSFLRNSGLMAGGAALATGFTPGMIKRAKAATDAVGGQVELKKTICTHCSVGCGIIAEVQNGVWTGQEPAFDHPFNLGAHCAKGASVREHGHGERRLKYPTKLVDGKWKRVSWEQAINEIGDKMQEIREQSGPRFGLLVGIGQTQ